VSLQLQHLSAQVAAVTAARILPTSRTDPKPESTDGAS
jgi:hypothetical protein